MWGALATRMNIAAVGIDGITLLLNLVFPRCRACRQRVENVIVCFVVIISEFLIEIIQEIVVFLYFLLSNFVTECEITRS